MLCFGRIPIPSMGMFFLLGVKWDEASSLPCDVVFITYLYLKAMAFIPYFSFDI